MRKSRFLPVLVVTAFVALAVPSLASANYYYSRNGAQRIAKDAVAKHYGYSRLTLSTSCRPQGAAAADSRFLYHRWVCGWARTASCGGQLLIVGSSSGPGAYYYKITSGYSCD